MIFVQTANNADRRIPIGKAAKQKHDCAKETRIHLRNRSWFNRPTHVAAGYRYGRRKVIIQFTCPFAARRWIRANRRHPGCVVMHSIAIHSRTVDCPWSVNIIAHRRALSAYTSFTLRRTRRRIARRNFTHLNSPTRNNGKCRAFLPKLQQTAVLQPVDLAQLYEKEFHILFH